MRKLYCITICCFLSFGTMYSQGLISSHSIDQGTPRLSMEQDAQKVKSKKQTKAPGAVLWSEDFGSPTTTNPPIPVGWTVTNNTTNVGNQWIWSNSAPGGQYSANIAALNSTTRFNGFISLPCDLYNTPFPGTVPDTMDTWITSPSFPIGLNIGAVEIHYEHYARYCCITPTNPMVLEVSPDGINWSVPYDAIGGRAANTITPNGEKIVIDVSADLGFQANGYLRFRSTGNSHYFWMIDDVQVIEGFANVMQLEDIEYDFHPNYAISPVYKILPVSMASIQGIQYTAFGRNTAINPQTNVYFKAEVYMDSTIGGGAGTGLVFQDSVLMDTLIGKQARDTATLSSPFYSFNTGWYRNRLLLTSDSINQNPIVGEQSYSFALTVDTVIALEDGNFSVSSGPRSYIGGGQDGDRVAALMILDSNLNFGFPVLSVSVFVANRVETDGLMISPRIWRFDETKNSLDSAVIEPAIASSPFSDTISSSQLGTWVTLPLFPPVALSPGAYYFGVEQTGGASNGKEIWLSRDVNQELIAPMFSNIFYLNDPINPRWVAPPRILGIRLNIDFRVGIMESKAKEKRLLIFPNPSNGEFSLRVRSEKTVSYQLKVRNNLGQIIHTESLNVKGEVNQKINLSTFEKGVYFLSLEDGEERLVKKVVVQ